VTTEIAASAPSAGAAGTVAVNRRVVRRYFDEVLNEGRLEVADELAGPGFVVHATGPVSSPTGPEGLKSIAGSLRARFPDIRFHVDDTVAEGDRVAVRWTFRGTNTGDAPGFPPATGRPAVVTANVIFRLEDGRLAELWPVIDLLGLVRQLGLDPLASPVAPPAGAR
jgi:steroid delta-isomerase-like uncharacterized protein